MDLSHPDSSVTGEISAILEVILSEKLAWELGTQKMPEPSLRVLVFHGEAGDSHHQHHDGRLCEAHGC